MANEGRYQFLPFIFTLVAIVLTDLLIGICIGMVLSMLFILNSNLRRPVRKIHVIRMPGVVVGPRAIGGVEYAVSVGGTKIVVVMGHADSSLLSLAIQNANSPDNMAELAGCAKLEEVLQQIAVSIDAQNALAFPQMSPKEQQAYLEELTQRHIQRMAKQLIEESPALSRLVDSGQIQVVTAMFDPSNGSVQFLNDSLTPAIKGTTS